MQKRFFNKYFEFGGTLKNLDSNKGNYKGIYIVVLPNNFGEVSFNPYSLLKKWRNKEVSVSVDVLKNKWVENTKILYIGTSERNVYKRMLQHIKFWYGKNVSAYGGRIIGQIQNFENLEVWYLESDNPKITEKQLLSEFKNQYEKLPFANWRN